MSRICKKCLIGQQAKDYLAMIEKSKAAVSPRDRAEDALFDRRISICEDCGSLSGPTCMACGCFVELRAIRKSSRCPCRKW